MKKVENDIYKTNDLTLATVLSLAFPFTMDKSNPRKVVFEFERSEPLQECVDKFWRGELTVEPLRFAGQTKMLKTRIYSET